MKMNMQYQPKKLSDKELLEMFPEARDIIPEKIKEVKSDIRTEENKIERALKEVYKLNLDEFSVWFHEKMIEVFMFPTLKELERQLFRLSRFLPLIRPDKYSVDNFQEQIAVARESPIYELARDKLDLRQVGRNFISLCPFHNERTPSFYLYTDSNQFHCYGCQEHGDVITLTMALYSLTFRESVTMLQKI